eukprot:TRINITY_DN33116_c0_g1_i2.p1 TRINITY_DN33116_c0_g1~~TRINITY_DN33116_c0_g1_i2.p1  ORF type:complete len:731 (-),score=22.64 TRINITY_DN33116_c0_g1_i2:76-2181(-)
MFGAITSVEDAGRPPGLYGPHRSLGVSSMLYVLISLVLVALSGYVSVRLRIFLPKAGHTYAMMFFVERVALPAVVFKVSSALTLEHLSSSVIVSCTLTKLIGMISVWTATFFFFQNDRSLGRRIVTATVFSSTITSTSDFAIGMPVLQSLHGSLNPTIINTQVGMNVYLVVSALIQIVFFNPLVRGLIRVGQGLKQAEQLEDSDDMESTSKVVLNILLKIVFNPVLLSFVAGITWKHLFGWKAADDALDEYSLSHLFGDTLELITSAYVVSTVFLLGTCIESATFTQWAFFIIVVKVGCCPFLGRFMYLFVEKAVKQPNGFLGVFAFFYGALPTSLDAYYLANKYDRRSVGVVSSCILFSLILVSPFLYSSLQGMSGRQRKKKPLFRAIYAAIDGSGLVCLSMIIFAIVFFVRRHWGFSCRVKQLLACHVVVLVVYLSLSLAINPSVNDVPCRLDAQVGFYRSPVLVMYGIFQCFSYFTLFALQAYSIFCPIASSNDSYQGYAVAGACFLLACIAGLLGHPEGYKALCLHPPPTFLDVNLRLSWLSIRFLVCIILFIMTFVIKPPDYTDGRSALGRRKVCVDDPRDIVQRSKWTSKVPRSLIQSLAFMHFLCAGLQFLVSVAVKMFYQGQHLNPRQSFITMAMVEVSLDHGQAIALLLTLLFDDGFTAAIRAGFQEMFGHITEPSGSKKRGFARRRECFSR